MPCRGVLDQGGREYAVVDGKVVGQHSGSGNAERRLDIGVISVAERNHGRIGRDDGQVLTEFRGVILGAGGRGADNLAGGNGHRESDLEAGVTAGVSGDAHRAEVGLPRPYPDGSAVELAKN